MDFNKKDVLIGFILVIFVVIGLIYYNKYRNNQTKTIEAENTPVSFQKELEKTYNYDIPDDRSSIELKDISGGNARGIATEKEILVDVEDPQAGYFYQAWLQNSNNQELISLGKLRMVKGGWLIEYEKTLYPENNKVIISLEKIFDKTVEKKILEGSF